MHLIPSALAVLLAYLAGSLSFAVIVSRWLGLNDPRNYGSGNPGATNVLRSGHKGAAALTLVFDALKGAVPVWLVSHGVGAWGLDADVVPLAGLAAFVGHVWPVFFQFKGGKGVATAAGVLVALHPLLGLATLLTWGVVAGVTRYSSLAALAAALLAPVFQIVFWGGGVTTVVVLAMSVMLVWRHQGNIRKLWLGTESKLGSRSTPAAPAGGAPSSSSSPTPAKHQP
ncbi:MAG: glycerol-3-phosphate 1-O-acyltransferase PlsY [Pseudomonadota bacterium]